MARTTTQKPLRQKRSHRCMRCSERKFRTPRDLALHILQKHGRIQLSSAPAEDAQSVTQNSPLLSTDVEELDQLLAAAENSISTSGGKRRKERDGRAIRKRRRSYSTVSDCSRPSEDWNVDSENMITARTNTETTKAVEGESIGPKSHDVFIARCRSGRIPLVPLPPQPVTMINFAEGLF